MVNIAVIAGFVGLKDMGSSGQLVVSKLEEGVLMSCGPSMGLDSPILDKIYK